MNACVTVDTESNQVLWRIISESAHQPADLDYPGFARL